MKVKKMTVLTLFMVMMLTTRIFAEVPYSTLYYDGGNHEYTAEHIGLSINGVTLDDDSLPIQPINIDGQRTLVPLREVFENLGATVNFDSTNDTVTVIDGSNTVGVTVGSTTGYINGEAVEMDAEPKYVSLDKTTDKKVMIPLRFVSEGLGYDVDYDETQRLVSVNSNKSDIAEGTELEITEINSDDIATISNETSNLVDYVLPTEDNQILTLNFDTPITSIDDSVLTDGRLVIDIENAILEAGSVNLDVNVGTLKNVRMAQFKSSPEYDTRIVLTFNADTTYTISLSDDRETLSISYADWGVVPENPDGSSDNIDTIDPVDPETPTDPVEPEEDLNASYVKFSTDGQADAIMVYGDDEAPKLTTTQIDKYTLYIDVEKPNTIVSNNGTLDGVGVESYKIYNFNDTITRIELSLKEECLYSIVKNGNLTKVYVKPSETISPNGGDEVVSGDVISLTNTPSTTTLRINKDNAGISSMFDISNIEHTDNYMEYQYCLTLPMSLRNVLSTPLNYDIDNENLESVDILNEGNSTKFVFNGKTVLYADVSEDDTDIIFTIKAARDVYDKIIVVDPGHGGTDPGTIGYNNGNTYYEKDIVLDIANRVTEYVSQDSRFKVYMTRTDDIFIPLYDRPAFSTNLEADLFVSIHVNSSTSPTPNGIDTFYFDVDREDESYLNDKGIYVTDFRRQITAESKDFAEYVQGNLIDATGATNRGFKHDNLAVLRSNDIPAVLIEVGFASNPTDLGNLLTSSYRDLLAKTIADSITGYYNNY